MVDYSHNICAAVSLAIVSCHADEQCTSSHSQLARTVENFLLSAPNMTPPGTMTASQPEGSFLLGTNLIPPCSVTILWSIFSNKVLPLRSGVEPRAMAAACIILRVSGTPMTNNFRGGKF